MLSRYKEAVNEYDRWMARPVYVVQCRTFKIALGLIGITPPEAGRGLATRGGTVLDTFRALPGHRDQYGQALRDMVALKVRMQRHEQRFGA